MSADGNDTRPSWDDTWVAVARSVGARALCENKQVGAVIVDSSNRVVSTGYNGPPAGFSVSGRCRNWCARSASGAQGGYGLACPSVHAEANALLWADRRQLEGGTIYVTAFPCEDCAKLIANSGLAVCAVDTLVYHGGTRPERANKIHQFLMDSGLTMKEV